MAAGSERPGGGGRISGADRAVAIDTKKAGAYRTARVAAEISDVGRRRVTARRAPRHERWVRERLSAPVLGCQTLKKTGERRFDERFL